MAAGAARKKTTWLYKNVMNKNLETQEDINYVEHRVPCPKYPTEKYNLFHFKSFKRTCTVFLWVRVFFTCSEVHMQK